MEVRVGIDIDRPADDVFAYIADMSNNPKWQQGQQRCEWTSEPPLRHGSTYDQEARFMGRTIRSSFEVVEFEQGSTIRIKSTSGMPIDVTRTVTATGDTSCRVEAVVGGGPPLVGPLFKPMVQRNVTKDYERLKELLERAAA